MKLPRFHSKGPGWIAYHRDTVTLANERATHRHAVKVLRPLADERLDTRTLRLDGADVAVYHRPGVDVSEGS
jgi:hypothetical protein